MCKIKLKINGIITEIEVSKEIYEFDKENFWQEDWRNRKQKKENDLDSIYDDSSLFNTLPKELRESTEEQYIKKFEIEKLYEAIESLPKKQRDLLF